jgi:CheY-like chemotaxis protein
MSTATGAAIERLGREHAGHCILLAEDNPIASAVAHELLRAAGLQVESVQDGAAAVEAVGRGGFDLVLMDVQMPGTDGLEATRALRAAGVTLPIVALTGDTDARGHAECLAAGMNDHVPKPVQARQLYDTLLRWLPPARSAAADAVLEALGRLDGLDPAVGLANVGGSTQALSRVLRRFTETYRAGVPGLADPTVRRGRRSAAHALRGVASTLGAVSLQGCLEDLERADDAGLDDAELERLAQQALEELRTLVAALDRVLGR